MPKRLLSTAVLLTLTAVIAHAAVRVPQVPVSGTALATFFASQGQTIDVNTQQLDLQTLSVPAGTSFEVHEFGTATGSTFGAYGTALATPPLYQIIPGAPAPGWFSAAAFRTSPTRLVVSIFDQNSAFMGSTTYLAGPPDPSAFGFYLQQAPAAGGTVFYTQDARNPGGTARILAYNATGVSTGWTWFACETGAGPGGDYADFIALVNLSLAPVPVMQTNWGTLKARFR
jgi:hypothetical protein